MSFSLEILDFLCQFIIEAAHPIITKNPTMGDSPVAITAASDAMH
jgi:hypothetical protein